MSKKIVSLNKEIKRQRYSWKKKIKEEKLAVAGEKTQFMIKKGLQKLQIDCKA